MLTLAVGVCGWRTPSQGTHQLPFARARTHDRAVDESVRVTVTVTAAVRVPLAVVWSLLVGTLAGRAAFVARALADAHPAAPAPASVTETSVVSGDWTCS